MIKKKDLLKKIEELTIKLEGLQDSIKYANQDIKAIWKETDNSKEMNDFLMKQSNSFYVVDVYYNDKRSSSFWTSYTYQADLLYLEDNTIKRIDIYHAAQDYDLANITYFCPESQSLYIRFDLIDVLIVVDLNTKEKVKVPWSTLSDKIKKELGGKN